jgi:hypothetical protein
LKYLLKKEFLKQAETSNSTLYNFYNKYPKLWEECILTSNRRLIPVDHIKYFKLEKMIVDSINRLKEIEDLKSFLDHIKNCNPDDLRLSLWRDDWDIYGTVSYKNELTRSSCRNSMSKLFNHLEHHYKHETSLRMFFNTEPYSVRNGHHNHFIMHISNKELINEVNNSIVNFFQYDHVDLQPYDKYQAGVFYICKKGFIDENWDDWIF